MPRPLISALFRAPLRGLAVLAGLALPLGAAAQERAVVAMADGVRLETFVHLPQTLPAPVLLIRTPYRFPGSGAAFYDRFAQALTDRDYAVVVQNLRGRFRSEGSFTPFGDEMADGVATLDWIRAQPWSNGRIATLGGSYNGYTALAAAAGSPHVQAVIADDPALDLWAGRRGGALGLLPVFWLSLLDRGDWPDAAMREIASNAPDPAKIDSLILGRDDPFWNRYVAGPVGLPVDSLRGAMGRICAPVLVLKSKSEGWEDPVDLWRALRETGCPAHRADHRLIVTAEDHTYHLNRIGGAETDVTARMIDWLDHWLRDRPLADSPPVLFRPSADGPFLAAEDWPLAGTDTAFFLGQRLSLTGNGHLMPAPQAGGSGHALRVDPATTSPCEDTARQTYLSDPLEQDLLIAGPMRLELFLRSTTDRVGLSAQIYEYDPARPDPLAFVTFGVAVERGLTPGTTRRLTLWTHSLSHRFDAGSRIALSVGGTACGYAELDHPAATYEILHGQDSPSRLVLEAVRVPLVPTP